MYGDLCNRFFWRRGSSVRERNKGRDGKGTALVRMLSSMGRFIHLVSLSSLRGVSPHTPAEVSKIPSQIFFTYDLRMCTIFLSLFFPRPAVFKPTLKNVQTVQQHHDRCRRTIPRGILNTSIYTYIHVNGLRERFRHVKSSWTTFELQPYKLVCKRERESNYVSKNKTKIT